MRVTKAVREFITEEAGKRIMKKYEGEKAESQRQTEGLDALRNGAIKAAEKAYNDYLDAHLPEYDYITDERKNPVELSVRGWNNTVDLTDRIQSAHVVNWHSRYCHERDEAVRNIIVTLDLGGTKAELMEMLDEL